MDRIKVAVIGCGTVAGYGHLPAIAESDILELAGVADSKLEKAMSAGKKYGVPYYINYEDLLRVGDIDAVIIATPTPTHAEIAIKAFNYGKHVFCEKPMAMSLEEADEMMAAASNAGKVLMIGFIRRFVDKYKVIRNIICSGELGEVKYIKQVSSWSGPIWAGRERYEWMINKGGGPLIDEGVHEADTLRWFTGSEAEKVYAEGLYFAENIRYPDHVNVLVKMKNGVLGVFELSWVYKTSIDTIEVVGTKATLIAKGDEIKIWVDGTEKVIKASSERVFRRELEEFARSIIEERTPLVTGEDGKKALEIVLAAHRSMLSGEPIKLPLL